MGIYYPEVTPNQGNTFNSAQQLPPGVTGSTTGSTIGTGSLQTVTNSIGYSTKLGQIASLSSGWYVFLACITGIATADTKVGPWVTGVLGLALIYQLGLYLNDK
jgi:hypothetical protein